MNTLRALPGTGSPTPDHVGRLPAGDVVFHTPVGTHRVPGWDTLGGRDLGTYDTLGGPDLGTYDILGGPGRAAVRDRHRRDLELVVHGP
jgi:hypothetical protein